MNDTAQEENRAAKTPRTPRRQREVKERRQSSSSLPFPCLLGVLGVLGGSIFFLGRQNKQTSPGVILTDRGCCDGERKLFSVGRASGPRGHTHPHSGGAGDARR